ncbi:MAG: CHASE domain-containing protein [Rhodospirillales bacterium]
MIYSIYNSGTNAVLVCGYFEAGNRLNQLPRIIALSLFAVAACIAAAVGYLLDRDNDAIYAERYEVLTGELERSVTWQIANYKNALLGVRGAVILGGRAALTRRQFETYFNSRDVLTEFPGIRGVGYIDRVPTHAVEQFVENAKRDGFPEFGLRELNPHSENRPSLHSRQTVRQHASAPGRYSPRPGCRETR